MPLYQVERNIVPAGYGRTKTEWTKFFAAKNTNKLKSFLNETYGSGVYDYEYTIEYDITKVKVIKVPKCSCDDGD